MALRSTDYTSSPLGLIAFRVGQNNSYPGYDLSSQEIDSLFSSSNKFQKLKRNNQTGNPVMSQTDDLHSDDIYNIKTTNIIDQLRNIQHLRLKEADFAYLKDRGVYPNNRLMIARRFPNPVVDDLYSLTNKDSPGPPLSTVIGYLDSKADIVDFSFNEEWQDSDSNFTDILNSAGKDFLFGLGGGIGNIMGAGGGIVPLPGVTVLFQRQILQKLGIIGENEVSRIPEGDPNLIKEAKARRLIGDGAGSGLKCKFSITLKTEYEQQFFHNVDNTIVFMDILANLLSMGTSNSTFYLGKNNDAKGALGDYIRKVTNNPIEAIKQLINAILDIFDPLIKRLKHHLNNIKESVSKGSFEGITQVFGEISEDTIDLVEQTGEYVVEFIKAKYRVRALGIIAALTGSSSTPWHITLGNPLRPIFCSGDMLCKDVNIKLGPVLAYNDLPSNIKVEIKLESARNLGLQEIFAKFNSGSIRVYDYNLSGSFVGSENNNYAIQPGLSFWTKGSNLNYDNDGNLSQSNVQQGGQTQQQNINTTGDSTPDRLFESLDLPTNVESRNTLNNQYLIPTQPDSEPIDVVPDDEIIPPSDSISNQELDETIQNQPFDTPDDNINETPVNNPVPLNRDTGQDIGPSGG